MVSFLSDCVSLFPAPIDVSFDRERASAQIDRLKMRQCVLALLNNARLHGGGVIRMRLTSQTSRLRITVADNGSGLSATEKAHVFERFYRGAHNTIDERDGSGLGLPIVRAITEAHGGEVTVEDAPGGGAQFHIDLDKLEALRVVS